MIFQGDLHITRKPNVDSNFQKICNPYWLGRNVCSINASRNTVYIHNVKNFLCKERWNLHVIFLLHVIRCAALFGKVFFNYSCKRILQIWLHSRCDVCGSTSGVEEGNQALPLFLRISNMSRHILLRLSMYFLCHKLIHIFIRTFICMFIHIFIHTFIRTFIHTFIHTYIQTYKHTYKQTYKHTYIHTYIHAYNFFFRCLHYFSSRVKLKIHADWKTIAPSGCEVRTNGTVLATTSKRNTFRSWSTSILPWRKRK